MSPSSPPPPAGRSPAALACVLLLLAVHGADSLHHLLDLRGGQHPLLGAHGIGSDSANSTLVRVLRMVKQCLGSLEHGGATSVVGGNKPLLGATFLTPPFPEPPPTSVELCARRGFQCERHLVRTDDGYVLALIHVVGRKGAPRSTGRVPVLVQHGMLMSSDAWLLRTDEDGNLPLLLSDAGYDVWVGNYRGNAVSPHEHATLSPESFEFWNFSWHEMGLHDLPALVDYVLEQNGAADLFYVGHSMGTTGMMVLLSTRPEYNAKIRLASLLAPVGFVSQLRSRLFTALSAIAPLIKQFLLSSKIYNVLPRSATLHRLADLVCLLPGGDLLCNPVAFEIAGWSPEHVFKDYTPSIIAYMPAGTTIRIMEHYYEVARTGKFRPLGYGTGDPNPGAEYNISAISAPIALYYSQNDYFIYPPDVDRLGEALPNLYHKYDVPDATFNHFDFILAKDAKVLLYNELLSVMRLREAEGDDNLVDKKAPQPAGGSSASGGLLRLLRRTG